MASKRFRVIERPELNSVLSELSLQNSGTTREQQKAALGRVKNVQYLIKGTITDFAHVQSTNLFGGTTGLGVFGGQGKAVMGMILYVVEAERGQEPRAAGNRHRCLPCPAGEFVSWRVFQEVDSA